MTLIDLLIAVIILVVVLWALSMLLPLAKLPAPVSTILYVVVVVIVLLWFVGRLRGGLAL